MAGEEQKQRSAGTGKHRAVVAKKSAVKKAIAAKTTVKSTAHQKKRKTAAKKKAAGNEKQVEAGFEFLTEAVVEELRTNSPQIAKKLVEKAKAGDTQAMKMLLAAAKDKLATAEKARLVKKLLSKEKAEKKSTQQGKERRSIAMNIEAAPEWGGEGKAESAIGVEVESHARQ